MHVAPFARCDVGAGCCRQVHELGWVTLHFVVQGKGELIAPGDSPITVDLSTNDDMITTFRRVFGRSQRPSPGSRAMDARSPHEHLSRATVPTVVRQPGMFAALVRRTAGSTHGCGP